MSVRPNPFQQFIILFGNLKSAARSSPERLVNFYDESEVIRRAVEEIEDFLRLTDFERRVFYSARKHFPQVPASFEQNWKEYKNEGWSKALGHIFIRSSDLDLAGEFDSSATIGPIELESLTLMGRIHSIQYGTMAPLP
jgi:hypothetical protein